MEKVIDFDQWIADYTPPVIEFVAVYDPYTGAVTSVGPSHAFESAEYKIVIDSTIAEFTCCLCLAIVLSGCRCEFRRRRLKNFQSSFRVVEWDVTTESFILATTATYAN